VNKIKLSVGIIDLTINNMFSIYRSCLKAGYKTEIIDLRKKKLNYDIIILPGVGAFRSGIKFLKKTHLDDKLYDYLEKPGAFIYGICLGMQLLFNKSYEFVKTNGLGLIDGEVVKFHNIKADSTHLGWSKLNIRDKDFKKNFQKFENKYFYFIHSYYTKPKLKKDILANSQHGNKSFCSVVRKGNIFGTQFHPEKSGLLGIEFLKNLKKLKN
jgi:glutamine amidotransferase|tara:strand:+ start:842 stop:1477 length:636 start_codon:yes stop_codon:yes gene_type:complete